MSVDYGSTCMSVCYWVITENVNNNTEFKQPRRLRQIKRHFKVKFQAVVTILRFLLFSRIVYRIVDKLV